MADEQNDEIIALRNECNAIISMRDSLRKLESNPDFAKVINAYLQGEPVRIAMLYGDASLNQDPQKFGIHRRELEERIIGVARFAEYLRSLHQRAAIAEKQLYDIDHPAEAEPVSSEAEA